IYRPGRITGHSQTGAWRLDDVICHMIKACIVLGKRPVLAEEDILELVPVDYVSQASVRLSLRKTSLGQSFHLCDPTGTKVNDITQWIGDFGYRLEKMDYAAWLNELVAFTDKNKEHGLSPFLPPFLQPAQSQPSRTQAAKVIHDNRYTLTTLARMNMKTNVANAQLLHTYITYMIQNNFLEAPGTS